jgi:hypothetical protein
MVRSDLVLNPPNYNAPMMLDLVQVFGVKKAPTKVTINGVNHQIFSYNQVVQVSCLQIFAKLFELFRSDSFFFKTLLIEEFLVDMFALRSVVIEWF